ncbi:MAG: 2-oxo acid dehydrogenase subunit E2 [Pseudomonadales bacterium]|nr:2-oxo acid dehydrogenase subunit E2 [Pseudomonadales bacterium]NRA18083.1 2-oxo acid dehydrogenase subunit E2 [Oceanospirillaceae bacterium]
MQNTINIVLQAEQLEGTEATVSNWLVQPGEQVVKDSPIVELETDKVAIEVTAIASGTLTKILAGIGDKVVAGDILAMMHNCSDGSANEQPEGLNTETGIAIETEPSTVTATANSGLYAVSNDRSKRHLLGPAVKKLLSAHNINALDITATGSDGRISKRDVQLHIGNLAKSAAAVPKISTSTNSQSTFVPHTPMRTSIASNMVNSLLKTSPHVTSVFEMDMSAIIAHRAERKIGYLDAQVKLTFTAYFLAASAIAIKAVPEINSQFHPDGLEIFSQINIGVGTALADSGLVVPVVSGVQDKSLFQIAADLTEQTERARTRKLTAEDMRGGTFTISNYGVSGSLLATPIIINQPQVAILGVGKMQKRVVVESIDNLDSMLIKPMCYVSLSIDHRALDAHQTNKFLSAFVNQIENWGKL